MERLTPEDSAFLHLEDQVSAMHSVAVAVFEGPEPSFSDIKALAESRVGLIPRFRQRYVEVPFDLERPVWVDDPHFKLSYHIRHTGLAEPTAEALETVVGRILSQRLDRGKPLWELWVVSNLADGDWAIISKAHHAIVDGVSGVDPLSILVEDFGTGAAPPALWAPPPLPSGRDLVEHAAYDLLTNPAEQIRVMKKAGRLATGLLNEISGSGRRSEVKRALSPHRSWSEVRIPFETVKARREVEGISTNDVLLAYVALGLRSVSGAAESAIWPGNSVTALVPYAVGPGGLFTNEVASLSAKLPIGSDDFDEVVRKISDQVGPVTSTPRAVSATSMSDSKGLAAPTIAALGVRRATRSASVRAQTVVVNAPGPRVPVHVLGVELKRLVPAIPLAAKVPLSIGIISYAGCFSIGVTVDEESPIDPRAVTAAIAAVD